MPFATQLVLEGSTHYLNKLHVHLTEDGYWIVLGGRARFYGEGDKIIDELSQYEGLLIPAGTHYWFEGISDEGRQKMLVGNVREFFHI